MVVTLTSSNPQALALSTSTLTITPTGAGNTFTGTAFFGCGADVTVTASSGGVTGSAVVHIVSSPVAPQESFALTVSPTSAAVNPGSSATYAVTITSQVCGVPAFLTVGGLPPGASVAFNLPNGIVGTPPPGNIPPPPNLLSPPGNFSADHATGQVIVSTSATTPPGTYPIGITGTTPAGNCFPVNCPPQTVVATLVVNGLQPPAPPPPPPVTSSITITRAELNAGQLRIEGTGAKPNAAMTVNGQALGTADGAGNFRLQTTGFLASTCTATVSDGTASASTPLAGC
jgi:hypothetical protein